MKPAVTKSFLLLVALLVGAELVVRVFFARSMSGRFDYGYHPTAGFVEQTDGTVRLERAGGRRFFPQSFSRERQGDTFRIFVIGDSVARGGSVAASYAGQLGELLNARGINTESFNLSVPGYGARRKQLIFEQALKYQPSLVILHLNDSNEYEDEREWRRREEFRGWHPKNWLMKSLVIRRLYEMKQEKVYWELLPTSVRNQRAATDADAEIQATLNPEKSRQWNDLFRRVTRETVAAGRDQKVRVLVVAQAILKDGKNGKTAAKILDDDGLEEFGSALREAGAAQVSMRTAFTGHAKEPLFSDSAHLKPAGHKLLAGAIAEQLAREGWLPVAKPR